MRYFRDNSYRAPPFPPLGLHAAQPVRPAEQRRFAPFFWTQFLGAGNDNVYKNALVIFVAFQAAST